jgi:hypothetical protein
MITQTKAVNSYTNEGKKTVILFVSQLTPSSKY